jgi:hypothetical protein
VALVEDVAAGVSAQVIAAYPEAAPLQQVVSRTLAAGLRGVATALPQRVPIDELFRLTAGLPSDVRNQDAVRVATVDRFASWVTAVYTRARSPQASTPAATALPFPAAALPAAAIVPTLSQFSLPNSWTLNEVLRALRFLPLASAELALLPWRFTVANALAGVAIATPGIRSTLDVGNKVHPELQRSYREHPPHLDHLVVLDRQVWQAGRYTGDRLNDVAQSSGDLELTALTLAGAKEKGDTWELRRRSDVADFGPLIPRAPVTWHWEIKPLLSMPEGVLQETWYRCFHNFLAQRLAASLGPSAAPARWMLPGPGWPLELLRRPIPVSVSGTAGYAVPFSVTVLPGMVGYFVVSGPRLADIAVLVTLMIRYIDREQARLAVAFARVIYEVAKVIVYVLAALVIFAAIAFVAYAIAVYLAPALVAAGVILLVASGAKSKPDKESGPLITLSLPSASVSLPAADVTTFVTHVERAALAGLAAVEIELRHASGGKEPMVS